MVDHSDTGNPYIIFGRNLAEAREAAKLTQEMLARIVNLPLDEIIRMEEGDGIPLFPVIFDLAKAVSKKGIDLLKGTPMGELFQMIGVIGVDVIEELLNKYDDDILENKVLILSEEERKESVIKRAEKFLEDLRQEKIKDGFPDVSRDTFGKN
jgi:transcriptional regulator with XRE-family HTH domain